MQVSRTNQVEILEAFRNRLLQMMPDVYGQDNVYFDDEPIPRQAPDFDYCCSLSVSNGVFGTDGSLNTTQAPCFVHESCHIQVSPMVRLESEQPHNLNLSLVYNRTTGLIGTFKPKIISALMVDYDGTNGTRKRWEPLDGAGNSLLLNSINLTACSSPQQVRDYPFLGMTLDFRVSWIWRI